MRGLDPRIHEATQRPKPYGCNRGASTWVAGSSPATTNDRIESFRLIDLRAGLLDHSGPLRNLGLDVGLELLRRVADDIDAEIDQRLLCRGVFQRFDGGEVQGVDDLLRR